LIALARTRALAATAALRVSARGTIAYGGYEAA
jgi:hypothetical protein